MIVLNRTSLGLALVVAALAAGCGGSDDRYPTVSSPGTDPPGRIVSDADLTPREAGARVDAPDEDGGMDGGGDGDGSSGDGAGGGTRISVNITAPMAKQVVPIKSKLAPGVDVTVTSPAGGPEDPLGDVNATLVDVATGKNVASIMLNQVNQAKTPESTSMIYRFADTPLDITGVSTGDYRLTVHAKTKGGAEADGMVDFQIDAGPVIRVESPLENKSYKSSASVEVAIYDDYFGPVSAISMRVGQADITFTGPGGATGHQYSTVIDFSKFSPPLEGEQVLTVRATNRNGVEAVAVRKFVSDNQGPLIANASPKDGELIGNVITISAEVTDPADVMPGSVVAVFANGPGTNYTIPLKEPPPGSMKPTYSALFDTRNLPFGRNALFPTLSFRAADTLGNESLISNVVWLDNRPPLSELDPPDIRIQARTERGVRCGWPFDPVGPDIADDGDLVTQIVDIRARVEDQGNDVLTGSPNYVPIAGVATAELMVHNPSAPLIVNTNPVAKGNLAADGDCDALNPLLVPKSNPMTANDALVITLSPITPSGATDFTNDRPMDASLLLVGDDLSCFGGGGTKVPDPVCNFTGNITKANWQLMRFDGVDAMGNPISTIAQAPHSEIVTVWLGYGTGIANLLPSIWTLPPVSGAGANIPTCGGTQLDALANSISDGWSCFAVRATDKLGNSQVSRPLRLCVDQDGDGKDCPHKAVARVHDGTPITVETVTPHGYTNSDTVKLSGITWIGKINNIVWPIKVVDATHFTLTGSTAQPTMGVDPPPFGDWVRPTVPPGSRTFVPGWVVRMAELPNCTGTQTAEAPAPAVDAKQSCSPWRLYQPGEIRFYAN